MMGPRDHDTAMRAAAAWTQVVKRAREDFTTFCRLAAVNQEGRRIELAEIHLRWHAHLQYCLTRGLHCMIIAHFGSGKSSSFSVPFLAWSIGRNPGIRGKVVCNSESNAKTRVAGVRRLIESPIYRSIFPAVRAGAKWSESEFSVVRGGSALDHTLQARPVFGKGIGSRADAMLFDDCVDQENSRTEPARRRVIETVEQTWLSRLEPGGIAVWVATPWHKADATAYMMAMPGWCCLRQAVSEDLQTIEQEVVGAGPDYPGLLNPAVPGVVLSA